MLTQWRFLAAWDDVDMPLWNDASDDVGDGANGTEDVTDKADVGRDSAGNDDVVNGMLRR